MLDKVPLEDVDVLLRSIDLITMTRPKALLWQAGVSIAHGSNSTGGGGGGALIVSGLNLLMNFLADVDAGCPGEYPHKGATGRANSKYGLCYKIAAEGQTDEGPCGSWCQPPQLWPSADKAWPGCGHVCKTVPAPKNVSVHKFPEAAWLSHRLLEYAFTRPKPSKQLSAKIVECPGCLPPKFVSLCGH